MDQAPNTKLVGILWHQGENDVDNLDYKKHLDTFISNIRAEFGDSTTPFILGGMVPHWVQQAENRINQQKIISSTPNRINYTGYADPVAEAIIFKPDNTYDDIHYDAAGMRKLGKRYFKAYEYLLRR